MRSSNKQTLLGLYSVEQLMIHAALAYSNLWFRKDRRLFEAARANEVETLISGLVEIAAIYKVSRTLPKNPEAIDIKAKNPKKGKEADTAELMEAAVAKAAADLESRIELKASLQREWSVIASGFNEVTLSNSQHYSRTVKEFAQSLTTSTEKVPLSAASKLLWFKFRHPIRIYDTRAVAALWRMGFGKREERSYEKFCDSWSSAFDEYSAAVDLALTIVANQLRMTLVPKSEWPSFASIIRTAWFRERTFDQFLWLVGDKFSDEEVAWSNSYAIES